jgi:hypothetical protein
VAGAPATTGAKVINFNEAAGKNDFFSEVNRMALQSLEAWFPIIFPSARHQPGTGSWRVSSVDLSRCLEEDISMHPIEGGRDFGTEKSISPIDVVIEHGGAADARQAAIWLCERAGVDPASLGWRSGAARRGIEHGTLVAPTAETDFADEEPEAAPRTAVGVFPAHCLDVPGLIGDINRWILRSALKPQPELAMLNTLAGLSTVYGRRYKSPINTRTNLYTAGLAPTASGKDHSRKQWKALLSKAGIGNMMMGDRVMSDSGLLKALEDMPVRIGHWDEFGMMMQAVSGKQAATHMKAIVRVLLEVYGSSNTIMLGNEYADRKTVRRDISQPNLSLYCTTTADTLYEALSSRDVVNGLLNRFIVLPSQCDYPARQDPEDMDPPEHIVEALKYAVSVVPEGAGNLSRLSTHSGPEIDPALTTVRWTPEAKRFLCVELDSLQEQNLKSSSPTRELWGRYCENVIKLTMIRAISDDPVRPVMNLEAAKWAGELVAWSIQNLSRQVENHVSDNELEAEAKRVADIISKTGEAGISQSELTRKTQWLDKRRRDSILGDLVEARIIRETIEKVRGKDASRFHG